MSILRGTNVGGNVLLGLALSFVAVHASHADPTQYLCVPDYMVGYHYGHDHSWAPTALDDGGEKFIVRRLKAGEWPSAFVGTKPATWGVFEFGKRNFLFADCIEPAPGNPGDVFVDQLICQDTGLDPTYKQDFAFNLENLRFQFYRSGSYTVPATPEERSDTPSIQIGKCSPF